ncbi:ATP-binding protein [Cytobacillus oceanisediminis]|uniref:ATP-binding protein n=1 Tax=Cytobacillus oceanisediminis TaxID=665099 RepID=UPI00254B6D26|nr:ATP-binding protein [Cytobacillus oceanisediminis]MDK7664400.1 ATP-binding protein [Cytobacillus oceanisediminis]
MADRKINAIKLSEYFSLQKNEMVTYKITPNISLSNNQNAKMWRMLHKIYEVYESPLSRISRNGFKFSFRERDTIWYDVVFKYANGKKVVEFYLSTPKIWSVKLREVIENYMKVTVEEVETSALRIPAGDIKLREIRLQRHDIFSLRTNASEQTSPIGSIMNTLNDISAEGDFARLSVCTEVFGRKAWAKNASWAHEKLSKGIMPQRARITPGKVLSVLKNGLIVFLNEVYDLINDTLNAISNVFFKSEKDFEKKKAVNKKQALIEEIHASRASTKSNEKINQSVWKVYIRLAAVTNEPLRSELILNTESSAFSEIAGDNELLPVKIRFRKRRKEIIEELNTLHLSRTTKANGDVSLLSCDELSKVSLQLPTSAVQMKFEDALSVNKKVETEIATIFRHKEQKEKVIIDGIEISIGSNKITSAKEKVKTEKQKTCTLLVGHSELKGLKIPVGIPLSNPNEFYKGYVFQGQMGCGKDTAIQNFVTEGCLKQNISFVVIDQVNKEGREGMANGIRDSLPPEKIVDIDLSNEKYLPPLDLTEVMAKLGRKGADRFANELIQFLDIDDMGQSRKVLRNFAKACNGSLYQLQQLLEDELYRVNRINELRAEGNNRLADELDRYTTIVEQEIKTNNKGEVSVKDKVIRDGQKTLDGKSGAILNRLDAFLGDDTLYNIFAQPPMEEMNFEKWMREGKTIIIRVPDRVLSQLAVKTLVHWITLKVLMTRLLMDNEGQENGAFIIFNEPQTYLKENSGLADLMARIAVQGRKERLGSIFACHHIGQIKEIAEDLISGGVHWFLFKNDHKKTFEALETELKPNFDVEAAMRTEKHHAICIWNFGGDRKPAFLVKMLKPSYKRYQAYDNSFLTKRHSQLFGRSIEKIEEVIYESAGG